MKSFRHALLAPLVCAAIMLQGCAGLAGVALNGLVSAAAPAKAVGDKVVLEGTRGLILAHNSVQGGLAIVTPLIRQRVLTAGQVDMVETLINQAEKLFAGADATLTVAERAASLMLVANQLASIGGSRSSASLDLPPPAAARYNAVAVRAETLRFDAPLILQ